jgi:hypothetical protein
MPATPPETLYDVFISYSHTDSDWVFDWLVPRLKAADLKLCTDQESFALGVPALINMENAVATSRHTLLVLTPAYLTSEWTMYEQILTQTQDPIGLRQRTIPVLRQPCDLPLRIAMLTYADLTGRRDAEAELAKVVRAGGGTPRPPQASQPKIQPSASPTPAQPAFDTAAVRELLIAAFGDEELTTFCYDNFRPVYEEFATGMSRTQKVQRLVETCDRRGEMAGLLAQVKSANPYQYTKFESRLGSVQPKPLDSTPLPDPLPANPFGDTLAVRNAERFIGREAELRRLQAMLAGGSVALQGEAKIGKSSLLWRLKTTWQGEVIGPLDCQELENRHDFYTCLSDALRMDETGWQAIRKALKARSLLLLLDELDVGPSIGLTYEDLARFRGVCNNHAGLKIVTVSRKPLKEVFPDPGRGSEAYNFLVPLTLGLMPGAESHCLLTHPWVSDAPLFQPAIRDELLTLAAGHPFKLQRAAFHRYEVLIDTTYDWLAAYRQDLENLL